jgi:hypothetical protein
LRTKTTEFSFYKTLVRPVLTYGNENWPLKRKDENTLQIFERRILRRIYGPFKENGMRRSGYNHDILHNEADTMKIIKVGRLRFLGQLFRMQEQHPCRK